MRKNTENNIRWRAKKKQAGGRTLSCWIEKETSGCLHELEKHFRLTTKGGQITNIVNKAIVHYHEFIMRNSST